MKLIKRIGSCELCISISLIVLITALAYLPRIFNLGLYREDWYLIWSGVMRTPQDFLSLYQADRPFAGYIYQLVYPLLGPKPLYWHLLSFLLRLAGVLAFFWLLRMLWPKLKFLTLAATALFAVYPGYLQQYNAVNKTFWLTSLTFAILSITLTIYALHLRGRLARTIVNVVAILLGVIYLLIIEFYIGFEVVRFILIWYMLQLQERKPLWPGLKQAFKYYLPYLLLVALFVYWRVFVFQSTRPTTDIGRLLSQYLTLPGYMSLRLLIELLQDFYETAVLAWFVPSYLLLSNTAYREILFAGFFGLAAVGLIVLYVAWLKRRALDLADGEVVDAWPKQLMIIGSVIILVTLIPMVLAGREVNFELGMRSDHYTIQSAFGVGILLVGVFAAILKPALQVAVICFLIGISVMTHVQNATVSWRNWELQKQVWWQMTWRVPDLEDGTLLMVNMPPDFGYAEGYEAWAPANLIYSQGERIPPITGEVFNREFVFEVQHGTVAPKEHRGISVDRDFGKTLLLSLPQGNSCVNVIDGGKYELSALDDPLVEIAAPYSRIEQIKPEAAPHQPPEAIFGPEPAHTWCYYYQKAMLARQLGDWDEIVRLGNEANAKKLNPQDRVEWMPFFEAYANTGHAQQAKRLAAIIKTEPGPRNMVCQQLYDRHPDYPGGYDYQSVLDYLCSK